MLSSLRLAMFRSHPALRLEFDGRPVALRGPNGAGKTNILEAISLLSPGRGLRGAAAADLALRGGAGGWKIAAELAGHEVESFAEGAGRQVRIDGKAAPQQALGQLVRMVWLVPAMDRLWIEAPEGRRKFLDRLTLSFEPEHAALSLAYERAMRERNRLLKDQILDPGWYGVIEARMAQAGAEITRARQRTLVRLLAAGQPERFPAADLSLDPGPGAEDLAAALVESRPRDLVAGRTLVGPHRADLGAVWREKAMPAALCSTGEQKLLLIGLVLANARAVAQMTGAPPILLLDEVAAHLDPERRAALYDELCTAQVQAFLTGTEDLLFAELGSRAQALTLSAEGRVSATDRQGGQ